MRVIIRDSDRFLSSPAMRWRQTSMDFLIADLLPIFSSWHTVV
jgi:hypothetical protein